jgi:hypothetical protein
MSNPTVRRAAARIAALVVAAAMLSGAACGRVQPRAPDPRPGAAEEQALLEELRALHVVTDPRDRAVDDLRDRFEALYRTRPATAEGAPEIVRDERELRGKIVLDALARAATVQSGSALAAIAADGTAPRGARRYALGCLESWGHALALPRADEAPAEHSRRVARR